MTQENRRLTIVWGVILSFIAILGIDFLFHAGIFVRIYENPQPPLLSNQEAFYRIPLGYLSFLMLDLFLFWLIIKFNYKDYIEGLKFGLLYGITLTSGFLIGLYSIIDVQVSLIFAWFVSQVTESGVAGMILASINSGTSVKKIAQYVFSSFISCLVLGIILQNLL